MSSAQTLFGISEDSWEPIKDGERGARAMYDRHYSCRKYKDGREPLLFAGPGQKMVLVTPSRDALFVWRKFISGDKQDGVNCAVFRNEGAQKSSDLILQAERRAWRRWPGERLYTYVNPGMVRSVNPGCCFKKAGWKRCGATKGGLLVFEKFP